jgi:sodium/potassium-transporting ATPase subunit alpha
MFIIISMPLSLTTVLILCVDLGTDMVPAISLAYEKAESDIMERPPRDQVTDHLVTVKLVSFAYLQIGVFQALAGFYSFFVVMNDYGFKMKTLVSCSGTESATCMRRPADALFSFPSDFQASKKIHKQCPCGGGDDYSDTVNKFQFILGQCQSDCNGNSNDYYPAITAAGAFDESLDAYDDMKKICVNEYDLTDDGSDCTVANVCTDGLGASGSISDFNDDNDEIEDRFEPSLWPFGYGCPYGSLKPTLECKYPDIAFTGRNPCYKGTEALGHAQTAAFVSIVIVQWADLVICKTRILSIYHQGMENKVMLIGLCSETLLCAMLAYIPPLHFGIGTRDIMFFHWCPSMPFSILIFLYDETRKFIIRSHKQKFKGTPNEEGWLERYTYY